LTIPFNDINKNWTLFLDRDGVINQEKHAGYINTWEEFTFLDGVPEAIAIFTKYFGRIFVVTNQRGVGKGITTLENLQLIHNNMKTKIQELGGHIDEIYFCPDVDNNSINRKPNPGMAFQANETYPEINFNHSIMIGNTISDMEFGKNIGAHTIFLPTTHPEINDSDSRIDMVLDSLYSFSKILSEQKISL